jgi:anti-sigma B factor antagonist
VTDFSVSVQSSVAGATVLALAGELDLAAAAEMRAVGFGALGQPDCSRLVLDVAQLTFVDSTGIGAWVELRNHATQHDQQLQLRAVSDHIARILEIGGLTTVFDQEDGAVTP